MSNDRDCRIQVSLVDQHFSAMLVGFSAHSQHAFALDPSHDCKGLHDFACIDDMILYHGDKEAMVIQNCFRLTATERLKDKKGQGWT